MNEQRVEQKVLALKYRPKRFEDLIGQSTISQTLSLALDSNRLSHAYLLSGLRGSGKTSTARIMAKALLCSQGPTSKPCDECPNCLSANSNRHLDIIEMDAASNRGIDDIKDLIEHTKYKPSSARFKVFIIDEVHMLTPQAFNALLKTLEEPPGFVKFILATTDPLKLPATILSRTQHFRFKKISNKDVIHHLSHILRVENVEFEPQALEILSRSGQGSLRDTLTMLDQAIIFSKGKITTSCVTDMLGMIDPQFMENIFEVVFQKGDIAPIIEALEEYEAGQVCDEMTVYLKEKMLQNDKSKFDVMIFDRFFRVIADAKYLLSLNSNSSFVLILMLSKMIEAMNLKTIESIIEEVEQLETYTPAAKAPQPLSTKTSQPEKVVQSSESLPTPIENSNKQEQSEEQYNDFEENIEEEQYIEVPSNNITLQKYTQLIDKISERSHELGECFEKNFKFTSYDATVLHITSLAEGEERKLLYKHFALIRSFVADVYGNDTQIEFSKAETEKKKDELEVENQNFIETNVPDDEKNGVSSMIEEVEFQYNEEEQSSGCVASLQDVQIPKASEQELQIQDLLNSKMINKAKELFDIKKINVQTKT
ncbi:MAG: DNA polymerase III subunit gamma/tau [Arcobacteraceae bacterium]